MTKTCKLVEIKADFVYCGNGPTSSCVFRNAVFIAVCCVEEIHCASYFAAKMSTLHNEAKTILLTV